MISKRIFLIYSLSLLLLLTPTLSHAMDPIVKCGFDKPCTACDFFTLVSNAMKWLVALITLVITLVVVWSGIRIATSGGNMGTVKEARSMFTNAVVGFAILLCAWLIIDTLMKTFLDQGKIGRPWNTISADACQTPAATAPTPAPAGGGTVGGGAPTTPGGGSNTANCAVETDPNNACYPSKLTCFGNANDASKICGLESGHGRNVMSSTDKCMDGNSFSGGLWQINILANYSLLPGCSGNFYTKSFTPNPYNTSKSSLQGSCLARRTNKNGTTYCYKWNCTITDTSVYQQCAAQTLVPSVNTSAACSLYSHGGWAHWQTSAKACGVI